MPTQTAEFGETGLNATRRELEYDTCMRVRGERRVSID